MTTAKMAASAVANEPTTSGLASTPRMTAHTGEAGEGEQEDVHQTG
jgi:hypothetical protein